MKDSSEKSITLAFGDYHKDRFKYANLVFNSSTGMDKLMNGQKFSGRLFRKFVLNCIPTWAFNASFPKATSYRRQVAWLPLVGNRGNRKAFPQHIEKDTVHV
ncbi:hypothetical protein BGZ76_005543 [Entomortierella beljakovae]|nr:hypothetical protein BGZ76_005543 [Entomortierella beljakovae]